MLHTNKVGMAVGGLLVLAHVAWSIVVALGWGQAYIDFIFRLHFIQMPVSMLPFDFGTAVELWIVVGIVGYIIGYVFATIWNKVQK